MNEGGVGKQHCVGQKYNKREVFTFINYHRCLPQGRFKVQEIPPLRSFSRQICTKYIPVPYVLRKKLKNVSCEYDRLNG